MKPNVIGLLLIVTVMGLVATAPAHAYTGPKFGPWLYFASYYFPPSGCCKGYCFSAHEFAPRYEDPPPLAPWPFVPGPPPAIQRKGKARSAAPIYANKRGYRPQAPFGPPGHNYQ